MGRKKLRPDLGQVWPEPVVLRRIGSGDVRADGEDADPDVVVTDLAADADPAGAVIGGEGADQDGAVAPRLGAAADDVLARRASERTAGEVGDVGVGQRDELV